MGEASLQSGRRRREYIRINSKIYYWKHREEKLEYAKRRNARIKISPDREIKIRQKYARVIQVNMDM